MAILDFTVAVFILPPPIQSEFATATKASDPPPKIALESAILSQILLRIIYQSKKKLSKFKIKV